MSTPPYANKSALAALYTIVRVAAVAAILLYLAAQIARDWHILSRLPVTWSAGNFGAALGLGLLAYLFLVFGWLAILHKNGFFQRRYLFYYFRIWFTAYLYRYVPGKVLLVTERVRLGAYTHIPLTPGAIIVALETLLVMYAALLLSGLALPKLISGHLWLWLTLIFLIGLSLPALVLALRYVEKLPYFGRKLASVASLTLGPGVVILVMLFYGCFWLLLGSSFFFLAQLFYPLVLTEWLYCSALFACAYAAGVLAIFAPGGLGVREGVLVLGLSVLMPTGVASALALTSRLWFTLIEILLLGLSLLIKRPVEEPD